jgi:hypothetical protein
MSGWDTARLQALSRRLGLAPDQLALAAARLAREPGAPDASRRSRVLAEAARPSAAAASVAALLTTPIASFALGDVDRALAAAWRTED